ncbi:antitoxin [Kitasatospora sp. NPDC052896]|uniref:antitoxin n=1 Tax=Kitasatospora sp. NPDC052896 TaxID=3364061 RepID=UPI0037CC3B9D
MGVFSWFRRREAAARAAAEQGGGTVGLLESEDRTDQERTTEAEQESLPGVPAARTAPDADATGAAPDATVEPAGDRVEPESEPHVAELLVAELLAAARAEAPAEDNHAESRPERPDTGDEAMGLMDEIKGKAEELKKQASHLAGQHHAKIDEMVDKAGDAIDKATKGKYSDKIAHGTEKAKDTVDGFAEKPADGERKPADQNPAGGPATTDGSAPSA